MKGPRRVTDLALPHAPGWRPPPDVAAKRSWDGTDLYSVTVTGNVLTSPTGGGAGGLFNEDGTFSLHNSILAGGDPALPPAPTALSPVSLPDAGTYGTEAELSVGLTSDAGTIAGQSVKFALGALQRWAKTDEYGVAMVKMPLLRQASAREHGPVRVHNRLRFACRVRHNHAGRAVVEQGLLPEGSYSVTAYFGVLVTLPDGRELDLTDIRYGPAEATLSGASVTGGGWIQLLPGAHVMDPAPTGRAQFGFVARYQKGTNLPIGQTQLRFTAGDLNFHSENYEESVVAGARTMFKGEGTINGTGNYGFLLKAVDADLTPSTDVDLSGIKIWDRENGDAIVYDNAMGVAEDGDPTTAIGGGSIVIHPGK